MIKQAEEEGLLWYRVELDRKDGSLKSCDEGEYASSPSQFIRYVQANNKTEACQKALLWYRARREKADRRRADTVVRRKANGLCADCEEPAAEGKSCCEKHLLMHREASERQRSGTAKPQHSTPGAAAVALLDSERSSRSRYLNNTGGPWGAVYGRLLRRFDELGPAQFRVWLESEIARHRERFALRQAPDAAAAAE